MKVLVACERSGIVRDAFINKGHDAWSCDLEPTERPGPHIKDDVQKVLDEDWDLMIAHPPCTYLCNSGVRWLCSKEYLAPVGIVNNPRYWKMVDARRFFCDLLHCDIPKICIENPIPHKWAELRKYDQIIQPWQFGHPEQKSTCLWLKGLPKLYPTSTSLECQNNRTHAKMMKLPKKERERIHFMSPGKNRSVERSRTYPGIAAAMAEQWG